MKLTTLILMLWLFAGSSFSQNSLVRLDGESGKFKNVDYLPCCSKLTVEGEISAAIVFTELAVKYEGTDKLISTSSWTRTINNNSEQYEIQLQEQLAPNTSYDFTLRTFKLLSPEKKDNLKKNLLTRIHQYLKQNISIERKKIRVDGAGKVYKELNEIINSALFYQRSLNGVKFESLSSIVKKELKDLNELSIKFALRKKNRSEKYDVTEHILEQKIKDMVELVYSEIYPFLSSDLVQQHKLIEIKGVDTEKMHATLPINAGVYAFSSTDDINNISEKNSGIIPGAGITIPFSRPFKVKNYSVGEFGLSFGVLFSSIKTQSGIEYGIPGMKLPIYAALGFKTLKVVRLNFGTLFTTNLANPSKLKLMPTVGINIELNLWLGIKRF